MIQLFKKNKDFGQVDLVEILKSNSRTRYSEEDLESAADLIEQCLKWVPKERIKACDAVNHAFFK